MSNLLPIHGGRLPYPNWINVEYQSGPQHIREVVIAFASVAYPIMAKHYREHFGWLPDELPDIERFDPSEPRLMLSGESSYLAVSLSAAHTFTNRNYDDMVMSQMFPRYTARLYSYVKAGNVENPRPEDTNPEDYGHSRVVVLRDRVATVLRDCIISWPNLGNSNCFVVTEAMTENYSDVQQVRGDRWVAGTYHQFDVMTGEGGVGQPVGFADRTKIITRILPPSPSTSHHARHVHETRQQHERRAT